MTNITLEVTKKCNSNCTYCFADKSNIEAMMSKTHVVTFLKEISTVNKINCVTITGGEPLLYVDLKSLIQEINGLCNKIIILTNGILLSDEVIELFRRYNIEVHISLDSFDAKYHNKVRGNHLKTLNSIKKLLEFTEIKVVLNTTISSGNIDQIEKIYRFATQSDIEVDFDLLESNENYEYSIDKLTSSQKEEIILQLESWGENNSVKYKLLKVLLNNRKFQMNQCYFCRNNIVVFSNEDVGVCFHNTQIHFGNLKKNTFQEIISNYLMFQLNVKDIKCFSRKCLGVYL